LDSGEPGISGAVVKVFNSSDVEVASDTTDADGNYLVTDLPVGDYYVVFTTPPVHDTNSPANIGGDDTLDSDAVVGTGETNTYAITTGSAEIYINAGFFGAPLPVELSSFGAFANNCKVNLVWETEAEENFSHFEIEHGKSADVFTYIGRIGTQGGNYSAEYKYVHDGASDINYYRLKMVDLDGSFEYSKIVSVDINCFGQETSEISMYPNPVLAGTSVINLKFKSEKKSMLLNIVDYHGRILKSIMIDAEKGWNNSQIDIKGFPAGMYFIMEQGKEKRTSSKFIITN